MKAIALNFGEILTVNAVSVTGAVRAICDALANRGIVSTVTAQSANTLHIRAIPRNPSGWGRMPAASLEWTISPVEAGVTIRADYRHSRSAIAIALLVYALSITLLCCGTWLLYSPPLLEPDTTGSMPRALLMILIGFGALQFIPPVALPARYELRASLSASIQSNLRQMGGSVVKRSGLSRRGLRTAVVLLVTILGMLASVIPHASGDLLKALGVGPWGFVFGLCVFLVIVCATLYLALRQCKFKRRLAITTQGISIVAYVTTASVMYMILFLPSTLPLSAWQRLEQSQQAARSSATVLIADDGTEWTPERIRVQLRPFLAAFAAILGLVALVQVGLLAMLLRSIRLGPAMLAEAQELLRATDDSSTEARAGTGILATSRATLVSLWLIGLATALAVSAMAAGVVCVRALGQERSDLLSIQDGPAGGLEGIARLLRVVLWDDLSLAQARRKSLGLWIGIAAFVPFAILLSCSMYTREEWKRGTMLRAARLISSEDVAKCKGAGFDQLAAAAEVDVSLVIWPLLLPHAGALWVGAWHRKHYVIVSSAACRLLSELELHALLAHEIAHVMLRHCRKHARLRFLSRVGLVGSSFVTAIENTFAYERAADRAAIQRLGVAPNVLQDCLHTMKRGARHAIVGASGRDAWDAGSLAPFGIAFAEHPDGKPGTRGTNAWRCLKAWWALYTGEAGVGYWHPSVDERIAAIDGYRAADESK